MKYVLFYLKTYHFYFKNKLGVLLKDCWMRHPHEKGMGMYQPKCVQNNKDEDTRLNNELMMMLHFWTFGIIFIS